MERGEFISLGLSVVLTAMTVGIHYRLLSLIGRISDRDVLSVGRGIAVMFTFIFVAHYLEIVLYALGYYWLVDRYELGTLQGNIDPGLGSYVYFSAVTYTSLGMGDIVPTGGLRLLVSFEALTGLVMITWSASYTFLHMQKYWEA